MLRTRQQGEVTCSPCPLTRSESILARSADKSRAITAPQLFFPLLNRLPNKAEEKKGAEFPVLVRRGFPAVLPRQNSQKGAGF